MNLRGKKVIVAGLFSGREISPEAQLASLAGRVEAEGGVVVGQLMQRRGVSRAKRPGGAKKLELPLSPGVLGTGKVRELALMCASTRADLVVFRNSLSNGQRSNLQAACALPVYDAASVGCGG